MRLTPEEREERAYVDRLALLATRLDQIEATERRRAGRSQQREAAIEGVVVADPDYARMATAMVEGATEFDFAPGSHHSLPDDLRERLVQWCADLHRWDRAQRNP